MDCSKPFAMPRAQLLRSSARSTIPVSLLLLRFLTTAANSIRSWEEFQAQWTVSSRLSRLNSSRRKNLCGRPGVPQVWIDLGVKRAKKRCDVRKDIDTSDLLRAVIGVSYVGSGGDWQQSARRLVDILIAGSRPT